MKRILSTLLAACMVLSMLVVVPFSASAAATGANENTVGYDAAAVVKANTNGLKNLANVSVLEDAAYIINSTAGFAKLRDFVTADAAAFKGKTIYLTADVDFTKETNADYKFAQIANFSGTFDGQGYTVTWSGEPMFVKVTGPATIKNLKTVGVTQGFVTTAEGTANGAVNFENLSLGGMFNVRGRGSVGGVVGKISGGTVNITNCTNTGYWNNNIADRRAGQQIGGIVGNISAGTVTITSCKNEGSFKADLYVGGIVGFQGGAGTLKIDNCINTGDILASGRIGGIVGCPVGTAKVEILNCTNTGTLTQEVKHSAPAQRRAIGGIAGQAGNEIVLTNCVNSGDITTAELLHQVGGLLGVATKATITGCENSGDITAAGESRAAYHLGGIIGEVGTVTVIDTANKGNISGAYQKAGGLIGAATNITVTNCENSGNLDQVTDRVGGIAGNVSGTATLENTTNKGAITASGNRVGGLVGNKEGTSITVTGCSNYGAVTASNSIGGLIGYTQQTIAAGAYQTVVRDSVNTGAVVSKSNANQVGGIAGCVCDRAQIANSVNKGLVVGEYAGAMVGYKCAAMLEATGCTNYGIIQNIKSDNSHAGIVTLCGFFRQNSNDDYTGENFANNNDYEGLAQWVGYQVKDTYTVGGVQYQDLRVVASIDSLNYKYVGFNYEAIDTHGNVLKAGSYNCQYVYEELYAEGGNLKASELRPNGYLFSVTLKQIPVSEGTVTFRVEAFAQDTMANGGAVITGESKTFRHVIGDTVTTYTANDQYSVVLGEATVVYQSPTNMNQDWGYYQFPRFYYTDTGAILASWNYSEDTLIGGGGSEAAIKNAISYDGGKTWTAVSDADMGNYTRTYKVPTKDGNYFAGFVSGGSHEFAASQLSGVKVYASGSSSGKWNVYLASDIAKLTLTDVHGKSVTAFQNPGQIQMLEYHEPTGKTYTTTKTLNWTNMPVYGQVLDNGNIVLVSASQLMGICNNDGMVEKDGVLYYATYTRGFALDGTPVNSLDNVYYSVYIFSSTDGGETWNCISRINRSQLPTLSSGSYGVDGPCEPSMTVMPDGSLVLVARTGAHNTQNKVSFFARSTDGGKTWDVRKFGSTGVLPQLLTLDCGVTISSYGRPGLYYNTTANANGLGWKGETRINDLSAVKGDQSVQSCFYTDLIPLDSHTALLIYTDFSHPNGSGGYSKAIMARTITIVAN